MQKILINDAIEQLKSSKATVYKHIKKCKIKTGKDGRKTYLTQKQFIQLEKSITGKTNSETPTQRLKKELKTLKIENIQLKTKAEVLEDQNKKIIFQMGAVAKEMQILEMEKIKLIEISEETKKIGIFKRVFQFWK